MPKPPSTSRRGLSFSSARRSLMAKGIDAELVFPYPSRAMMSLLLPAGMRMQRPTFFSMNRLAWWNT